MNKNNAWDGDRLTYSAQEVADMLGIDHKTVRRAMDLGQIPYIPIGRLKRIPRIAFNRLLESGGQVEHDV